MGTVGLIILIVVVLLALLALVRAVHVVPQASAAIVERFGRYARTLGAGLHLVVPFIDSVRNRIDLREQVISFPPQPVLTRENLVVSIDTVIYCQVTDPRAATYEVASYIQAIEQLTTTTLRKAVGGMDLERTMTSREEINTALRGALDVATGKWGIVVNRVEVKSIDPPASIQEAMELELRAERDKRATILAAEGSRQSAILIAEGARRAALTDAETQRDVAAILAPGGTPAPGGEDRGHVALRLRIRQRGPSGTFRDEDGGLSAAPGGEGGPGGHGDGLPRQVPGRAHGRRQGRPQRVRRRPDVPAAVRP
nr:paraslipin [Streptomyces sp. QL37]